MYTYPFTPFTNFYQLGKYIHMYTTKTYAYTTYIHTS